FGLKRFARFATEVWQVDPAGRTDEEIAAEGLKEMESWMKKLGVALSISELGATEDMIEGIADGTVMLDGGYKKLTRDEVVQILRESLLPSA
ncbi:MAG: iron-containing alcohol dehydrogenase, partial [Clostridia bacterium]|nr:iron-containing alcohol dehydrogenase [Clostridia bacterium]